MATVHITFRGAHSKGGASVYTKPRAAQTIASTGASQTTTTAALQNEVCRITTAGNVFVNYGAAAASGSGDFLSAGASIDIVLNDGDTVSVIDA